MVAAQRLDAAGDCKRSQRSRLNGRFFCFDDLMLISIGRMSVTPSKQVHDKHAIRAALYARISTINHGQDPEIQLRELRDYCQRRGFTITGEYVDRGISGSREKRPALDKLLSDCRRRLVDAVVVYRYDRFARSLRQLVNSLEEFRALNIEFISIHEGVDTSTPNGRLVFGIFASIAEFERELIRDRVRSGLAAAKAKGKRIGRPRVAVNAARVASLRQQGRSWAEITQETGISKGTAQRALAGLPKTPVAGVPTSASFSVSEKRGF